ncbi:MAG: TIGR02678 family protein [Acidimicrobiia bacterium]|nr:TIGR02678 family protein [Acidimicrobiia bacterium]MYG58109.1 TIGR02678 family protein [Acidimicrobiia bacterium]MYJ32986.1 TIGR02678 family protein [Acidimicrobiia bacterium]
MNDASALADPADPQRRLDIRAAARHLVRHPLVLAEKDPEMLMLIRRNEQTLDRMFTQRFGYRLQVTADTARLYKTSVVAYRHPLLTATSQPRPFSQREYTLLALTLAAIAAGPSVISLRDLIHEVRSAAADADIALTEEAADRRALVTALKWMIQHGVAREVHEHVDRYAADESADAVLSVRPDRVALLPLPALARSETTEQVLDRSDQRLSSRAWMRSVLLEEPVLLRTDLADSEWSELRQRLGEEAAVFDDMFGLRLESRAEGIMVIDPEHDLTDSRFPRGGTLGHAALLLIDRLVHLCERHLEAPTDSTATNDRTPDEAGRVRFSLVEVVDAMASLADEYRSYWAKDAAENPDRLAGGAIELLCDHRLVEADGDEVWLLPPAWRYSVQVQYQQESLL